MISRAKLRFAATAVLAALPLALPGTAGADRLKPYLTDGTKVTGTAVYSNPNDGLCVVGLKFDGTLDVNPAIDNYKDCIVYTNATIKSNTTKTACEGGTGNTDGYKHAWSTSICVDDTTNKNPISRVDLDNTAAMCAAKGGVVYTGGLCVAHSWQYQNTKPGETIPYRSTINPVPAGYKGRAAADNLGFCYTTMRLTTASGYGTAAACPSAHNSSGTAPAGEWTAGTDAVLYQSLASYDAGLGWSFATSNCLYAYGTKGYVNAALTKADGTTFAAAGAYVDLTALATQGDCLANGGSWDNWIPSLGGVAPGASPVAISTTPSASTIMKLDSTTPLASDGGQFYSGTGSVCTKCHTDQSRSYMERYKPGFFETPHKLAGDTMPGNFDPSPQWGLKGVQCEICHATGRPAQQDVGLIVYPNTTGPLAGLPRAATGHNQTEYGSHVTGVCYGCHGTATIPDTGSPAAVIPVASGDFAPTAKGLAPIVNQFLNSPHASYTGNSKTVNVITRTNYASAFEGLVCRSEVGDQSRTYATLAACTGAGLTWTTAVAGGNVCVHNTTSCAAAGLSWATNQAPYTGVAGVCYGVGAGSILTTVYQGGVAMKIENHDTAANTDCTNLPTATPSGAGGYWVRDGEAAGTSNGVAYVSSDQGNCMTCHDVHWKIGSALPDAEPIRRECTTCHSHSTGEASVTNAPQLDIAKINHPGGVGTPLANVAGDPSSACVMCHMPKSSASGAPMHLWRVNTTSAYSTMGATQANTTPDGTYANAAWVDLDFACGQCHGGSAGSGATKNGAPYITKAALATYAAGIHNNAATASFTGAAKGLIFRVDASSSLCGGNVSNCDSFTWNWGDTTTSTKLKTDTYPWLNTHTYTAGGPYTVTLTVSYQGVTATASKNISLTDTTPATIGGGCTFDPNTWIASVTDSATTVGSGKTVAKVVVSWGDGTPYGIRTTFPVTTPITHTYLTVGSFTVKEQVIDSLGGSTTATLTCTPAVVTAYFTVTGKVTQSNGTTPIASAVVKLMKGTTVVKSLFTDGLGNYTAGSLKPGTYTIAVTKTGVTFGNPAPTATVGPNQTGINVSSTVP